MSTLVAGVVTAVTQIADDLHTSDEERLRAQIELTALDNQRHEVDTRVQLAQIDVNRQDAQSDSFFQRGWRPATGWACVGGLTYQIMLRPVAGWVAENTLGWTAPPELDLETLMTLLFGILGLGAYRTIERFKRKN